MLFHITQKKKLRLDSKNAKSKHSASLGTISVIPHYTLHANREKHYTTTNLWAYFKIKKYYNTNEATEHYELK